jgi:hypothetical protein
MEPKAKAQLNEASFLPVFSQSGETPFTYIAKLDRS